MNFFYKDEEDNNRRVLKREENAASDNTYGNIDEYDDINDQTSVCSESIINRCIELMKNGKSPLEILKLHYGEDAPIFNILFLKNFIQFFSTSAKKDLFLTYFIINGPVENATRLINNNFFNILFTDMPNNFTIVHHLISKTTSQGRIRFAETGGIYVLCNFVSDPRYALLISDIFKMLSNQENIDFFSEILPPNAFYPVICNFETTIIYRFKDFIKQLFTYQDFQVLSSLVQSLKKLFHKSEKAIQKLGNLVFKQLFIERQLFLEQETQLLIPDLIELFNILCDYFDFEFFKIDMIEIFYTLMETNDFKQKLNLIPFFLSMIDNISIHMLPSILGAKTLQILEDLVSIEYNLSLIPNIIETISDIATKIIMYNDEYHCNLDNYLSECRGILEFLCENDDHKISELAESNILLIDKIISNYK